VAKDKKRKAQPAVPVTPATVAPGAVPTVPPEPTPEFQAGSATVTEPAGLRPDEGGLAFGLTRLASALGGASLVFGEPIRAEGRTVVPVARMRGAGGMGFGRGGTGPDGDGDGGGGGGAIEATPAGFLDITADGVRYEAIPDPVTTARAISTGASALTLLVSVVIGSRRLGRRRAAAALMPPR
jgi:uncharacterized spore protein YtfJ